MENISKQVRTTFKDLDLKELVQEHAKEYCPEHESGMELYKEADIMAKESPLVNHIDVISKMKDEGKTYSEIADFLNENEECGVTKDMLKSFWRRYVAKQNDEDSEDIPEKQSVSETAPKVSSPETINLKKIENIIENEIQMRVNAKKFALINDKYLEGFENLDRLSAEFCKATKNLKEQTAKGRQVFNLLFVGSWLITLGLAIVIGYYLRWEYAPRAHAMLAALLCLPGGIIIGLAVGIVAIKKKSNKKA